MYDEENDVPIPSTYPINEGAPPMSNSGPIDLRDLPSHDDPSVDPTPFTPALGSQHTLDSVSRSALAGALRQNPRAMEGLTGDYLTHIGNVRIVIFTPYSIGLYIDNAELSEITRDESDSVDPANWEPRLTVSVRVQADVFIDMTFPDNALLTFAHANEDEES